jgi:hypothetical protein
MEMAWIFHPGLDRTVQVPASAVRVWVHAGWEPVEPPAPSPAPNVADPVPTRRRRTKDQPAPVGETEE